MNLVIAKPPFPTEGRRWASERGKIRTSDLLWVPLLACHLPWNVVVVNPPTYWEKESNFSQESPFQRSHYHSGLLVYLSKQHPHLSETCPLRSALVALFVLDEPTHMTSTIGPEEALRPTQGTHTPWVQFGCGIPKCHLVSVVPEVMWSCSVHIQSTMMNGWAKLISQRGENEGDTQK